MLAFRLKTFSENRGGKKRRWKGDFQGTSCAEAWGEKGGGGGENGGLSNLVCGVCSGCYCIRKGQGKRA